MFTTQRFKIDDSSAIWVGENKQGFYSSILFKVYFVFRDKLSVTSVSRVVPCPKVESGLTAKLVYSDGNLGFLTYLSEHCAQTKYMIPKL